VSCRLGVTLCVTSLISAPWAPPAGVNMLQTEDDVIRHLISPHCRRINVIGTGNQQDIERIRCYSR
jgi:hypothetical protein